MSTRSNQPRFLIGIDLGTTNCALAAIDSERPAAPTVLQVPQWETDGALVEAVVLPSFYFLPTKAEWRRGQLKLPMHRGAEPPAFAVGRMARLRASDVPGRVIHSAKSWLCHPGVDREARILPWHSDEIIGDERRSPVEVSAAFLAHLKDAWDARFPADPFTAQDITITVPASFDEAAQRLTLAAADLAGYPRERLRLLEEPQAAFYHWLALHGDDPAAVLGARPQTVLICDVGGGTTDFSLFSVAPGTPPEITRIAVSEHLLLGGDNIDLSLAHVLERRLVGDGRRLTSRQWAQLVFATREVKEQALGLDGPAAAQELFVSVAGEGASLFATAMTASLTPGEARDHVLGGFFPVVAAGEVPRRQRGALTQLGLPYAQDSAITRHLAAFLGGRKVDAVLYTGGTLKPALLTQALTAQLTAWQGQAPLVLGNDAMDLAVALGAAHYGAVLRRPRGRIRGGYPRSLYVEAAQAPTAADGPRHALLCVVPKGFEGAEPLRLTSLNLKLLTGRPARFQLFSATARDQDQAGAVVDLQDGEFHPLPALHTRLDLGKGADAQFLDVVLEATLLETGLLQLALTPKAPDAAARRWQLEFNVRGEAAPGGAAEDTPARGLAAAGGVAARASQAALDKLISIYGKKPALDAGSPRHLARDLEGVLGMPREQWDTALLRSLWPSLSAGLTRRGRSVAHEVSWLYLAGYALRPGYGAELDEWRVAELWRAFEAGLVFPKERQVEEQWWIMWRRVAGGLSREQQERIFDRIFPALRKGEAASPELYTLAGSLERLEMGQKVRLGTHLAQQIAAGRKQFLDQRIWALARVASRVPLYAGPQAIVRPKFIGDWYGELAGLDLRQPPYSRLTLFLSQAGRVVQDREFDLPSELQREFAGRLTAAHAPAAQVRVVQEFVPVDEAARSQLFGESLPAGLLLG